MSNIGVGPLWIKFPQLHGYVKYFDDNNKCINFLVQNYWKHTTQYRISLVIC